MKQCLSLCLMLVLGAHAFPFETDTLKLPLQNGNFIYNHLGMMSPISPVSEESPAATFTPIVTLRSSRNPSVRTSEALDETDREYTTYTGSDQESPKIQRNTKKRLTEKTHILALKDSSRDGDDDDTAAPTPLTAIPRSTSHIKLPLYTESSSESFKRPRVDELSSDFIPPAPGMVGNKRSSWSREGGSGGVSDSGSVKRPHTTPITAKELPPLPHNAASTSPSQQNFPDIIQVVQPNAKRLAKNLHEQAVWNNWIAKVEDLEKKISDDEQSPNNQPLAPELTLQARPKSALDGSSASRKSALAKEYGGCGGGDNNGVLSFKRSYSCRGFRKSELFHDVLYSIKYPARPSTPLENGGDVWPSRTHESSKLSDHHDQVVDEIGIDEIMELYAGRSTVPSRLYPSSSSISSDEHSSDDDSMSDFINLEHQLNPSDISSDEDDMQDISTYDSPDDIFRKNSKPVSFHIDPEPSDLHHLDSDDSDDDIDNNRKNNDNQQIPVSTTSSSTSSYMSLPPFENVRANPNSFIRPGSGFSPSDSKEEAEARYRRLVNGDRDYLPNPDFFEMIQDPDVVGLEERRGFVLFMQHLSEKYHISKETVYLALNFMDRVLSKVQVKELGPIGLTCFYIAQKLTEDENKIDMESLGYQAYFSQKAYVTPEDLEILEMVVLKHLDYRLHVTTPHAVLDELLLIIQYSGLINEEIRFKLFWACQNFISVALTDLDIVSYPPVVLAFASLSLVLSTIKQQHLAGRRNTLVNVEELEAIGEISSPAFELHADIHGMIELCKSKILRLMFDQQAGHHMHH